MRRLAIYTFILLWISSCDESQPNDVPETPLQSESTAETVAIEALEFPSPLTIYKPLSYKEVGRRKTYSLKHTTLKQEVDVWLEGMSNVSLEDDIYFALEITAKRISFTTDKCSTNPNKVYDDGETHCVGYSAFFNTVLSYIIQKRGWQKRFKTTHLIGKIDMLGADLHKVIDDPFFKDHDFNKIEDLETGEAVYVDPSLYDYMGIVWVKVKE